MAEMSDVQRVDWQWHTSAGQPSLVKLEGDQRCGECLRSVGLLNRRQQEWDSKRK
jgi:hypothetical protein